MRTDIFNWRYAALREQGLGKTVVTTNEIQIFSQSASWKQSLAVIPLAKYSLLFQTVQISRAYNLLVEHRAVIELRPEKGKSFSVGHYRSACHAVERLVTDCETALTSDIRLLRAVCAKYFYCTPFMFYVVFPGGT